PPGPPAPPPLVLHVLTNAGRTAGRPTALRFEHRRRAFLTQPSTQDIERLPRDPVLNTEAGHGPSRSVLGPARDRQTDARIYGLILAHPAVSALKCHHQEPQNCHRCPDTELSPMSCDITARPEG